MHLPCDLEKSNKLRIQKTFKITNLHLSFKRTDNFILLGFKTGKEPKVIFLQQKECMIGHVTISDGKDRVIITVKLTSKSHLYASLNTNDMVI